MQRQRLPTLPQVPLSVRLLSLPNRPPHIVRVLLSLFSWHLIPVGPGIKSEAHYAGLGVSSSFCNVTFVDTCTKTKIRIGPGTTCVECLHSTGELYTFALSLSLSAPTKRRKEEEEQKERTEGTEETHFPAANEKKRDSETARCIIIPLPFLTNYIRTVSLLIPLALTSGERKILGFQVTMLLPSCGPRVIERGTSPINKLFIHQSGESGSAQNKAHGDEIIPCAPQDALCIRTDGVR